MARYEYSSKLEEIEVSSGQAFTNEEWAHRYSTMKKSRALHQIDENFRIKEINGTFYVQYLINGEWATHQTVIALDGTPQNWWCFDYNEALELIQALMTLFGWMGGIAAPTIEEETFEDMLAAQYNETLLNQVIYYTENSDRSERVARLLKASRDGVLLADPAEPSDQGCWYSFSEVSNIQRGRQYGWK